MDEKKNFYENEINVSIADAVKGLEAELEAELSTQRVTETFAAAETHTPAQSEYEEPEMSAVTTDAAPEEAVTASITEILPERGTVTEAPAAPAEHTPAGALPADTRPYEPWRSADAAPRREFSTFDAYTAAPKKRSGGFGRKAAAIILAAVLGGGSLGLGLSVGGGIADKYFLASANAAEAEPFSFATSPAEPSLIPLTAQAYASNIAIPDIVEEVVNSVVSINVTTTQVGFYQTREVTGGGSGIIFMEDGEKVYIATNNHVIESANQVTISVDDFIQVNASLVGTNPDADIAVISVAKSDMIESGVEYTTAQLGDSTLLRVGEPVIAIGNALGEGKTATMGIISAKNKQLTVDNNKALDVIQTDAAINSGNSGGALVNMNGEVIGINTAKLAGTGIEGMGYSIPISEAKNIMDNLMASGPADKKPYLGISGESFTEQMGQMYNVSVVGVYVSSVTRNGTAYSMGMRPGDIIVGLNGETVADWDALVEELGRIAVGNTVTVDIYRNGVTPMTLEGEMLADPSQTNF